MIDFAIDVLRLGAIATPAAVAGTTIVSATAGVSV